VNTIKRLNDPAMLAGESLRILFSRRENVIMAVVKFVLLAEKSWRVDLSRAKTKSRSDN